MSKINHLLNQIFLINFLFRYKFPTLTMLAEKEFIVCNGEARRILKKSGSEHNEIVEFKDAYHEL